MEVSKLSFRKETKEQMSKPISNQQKGKLLFARLEELDRSGELSKARTRSDVARLVGYPEERAKSGQMWVSYQISKGHLQEIMLGWLPSGARECEYHLTGSKPGYNKGRPALKRPAQNTEDEAAMAQTPQAIVLNETPAQKTPTQETVVIATKVEIVKGDITIKLELCDSDQIMSLVKQLLKGE